jgi:hypothetical protein
MLVYFKEPMGHTVVDGYRIYGRKYAYGSFGSTDLPLNVYKENRELLEDAEYTTAWLEKKFKRGFPPLSFTIKTLYEMQDDKLIQIATLIGIKSNYSKTQELTIKQRHALRKSIIYFLNH